MKKTIAVLLLSSMVVTGCTTQGNSVGDMAIGDDSAAIKAGRNRASARFLVPSWSNIVVNVLTFLKNWHLSARNAPTSVTKLMEQWVPQLRLLV